MKYLFFPEKLHLYAGWAVTNADNTKDAQYLKRSQTCTGVIQASELSKMNISAYENHLQGIQ